MSRRTLVIVLLLVWLAMLAWSVIGARITPPTGDGFTRGLNRLALFMGWQAAAGVLGLVIFAGGRGLPRGWLRRLTWAPLGLAGLLVAGIVALIVWARINSWMHRPAADVAPPAAVTEPVAPTPTD